MAAELWIAIGTGVVSLVGALGGAYLGGRTSVAHQAELERRSLASGFRAEIRCYLSIVEKRGHEAAALAIINRLEAGELIEPPGFVDPEETPDQLFPFYRAHVAKVGALGPETTERLGTFYNLVMSVRIDLLAWERGRFSRLQPQQLAKLLRSDHDLWTDAVTIGRSLEKDLQHIAGTGNPK